MIVSERLKLIFVHVPKTGGFAVREALREATDDARVAGPWHLPAMTGKTLITGWRDYTSIAFVRNPWERMVSAYTFASPKMSFEEFVRSAAWPDMRRPQTSWLIDADGSRLVSMIGRYESIGQDFARVCCRPLKLLNASVHGPYQDYYTDKTKERVAALFANDIAVFDYHF